MTYEEEKERISFRLIISGLIALWALFFWMVVMDPSRGAVLAFNEFKKLDVDAQQRLCITDQECEWAFGLPVSVAMDPTHPKVPRLVGLGCSGAKGPIYAFEEDNFPTCEEIRPIQLGEQR